MNSEEKNAEKTPYYFAKCWAALKCASTDKIAYVYKMKVVSKTYASACSASA